jgi:hypothetical protein
MTTDAKTAAEIRQQRIVAFLMEPANHSGERPTHIETHLSHLFLSGTRALKLKKAVLWSMVDYSTVERRQHFCRKELDINKRFAGKLYVGLRRVTDAGGTLQLDGSGETVDWLVEMRRFDDGAQLDTMVDAGTITASDVERTADAIAQMHRGAPSCGALIEATQDMRWSDSSSMTSSLRGAIRACAPMWPSGRKDAPKRYCDGAGLSTRAEVLTSYVPLPWRPSPFEHLRLEREEGVRTFNANPSSSEEMRDHRRSVTISHSSSPI